MSNKPIFCAIDSEGDTGDKGFLGFSYWSDQEYGFTKKWHEARKILLRHAKAGYTFVAHNAEYDTAVLFWLHNEHARCIYFNSKFNHAEWFYDYYSSPAHIWDSVGLSGGVSLAKLGDSLGLPKYETPQIISKGHVDKYEWQCETHKQWECIECYATRDVEIVYNYIRYYVDVCGLFNIEPKRTIGSTAVAIWKHLEAREPIWIKNNQHRDFARQAYHGGRVETFKLGLVRPCWTSDVISMYPYIMSTVPMPNPHSLMFNDSNLLDEHFLQKEGCSEVTIEVPKTYIPVLPVLFDNRVYFPIGRIRGTWINAEIRAAIERGGRIIKVHKVLYANETYLAFSEYVNELIRLRNDFKNRGDARQQTVKILLNSLYGRIGLQNTQVEEHIEPMPEGTGSMQFPDREWRVVNNRVYMRKEIIRTQNPRYGNVLWAATITGYARLRLLKFMEQQGSNLVYCDTDSVFSMAPIKASGTSLGDLSQVEEWESCHVVAPKLYRLRGLTGDTKTRVKGVPVRYADAYLDTGEASYSQPHRAREMLHTGGFAATWRTVTKTMRTSVTKRQPLDIDNAMSRDTFSDTEPLSFLDDNPMGTD